LLFYQYILRENNLHTVYLGQSLPYDSLVECVRQLKPRALVTSWLTAVEENFIENYFQQLKKEVGNIPIMAGGYQIKLNGSRIDKWIVAIENVETLGTHFS
jgi:cobalamin-dependent methionine synthase I